MVGGQIVDGGLFVVDAIVVVVVIIVIVIQAYRAWGIVIVGKEWRSTIGAVRSWRRSTGRGVLQVVWWWRTVAVRVAVR